MAPSIQPEQYIAKHVSGIPRSGIREFFDLVQGQADVISLGVGEPDCATPWHIPEAASLDNFVDAWTNTPMPR